MTTLQILRLSMLFCVFGIAFADKYDVQKSLHLLEDKMSEIVKKEISQQEQIEELTSIVQQQANEINTIKEENKVLREKIYGVDDMNTGARVKRQILNSSYEGPIAFMSSFDQDCQQNIGVNQNVVFKTVAMNLGGAYNPLHGVFLVPRDGVYLFSASLLSSTQAQSTSVHAAISVNGNKAAKILAFSEANRHRDQGSNTLIADLKKGDQVWVKNIDNYHTTICGMNGFSTFSGYLLYPY